MGLCAMNDKKWILSAVQSVAILLIAAIAGFGANGVRSDSLPLGTDWSPAARLALASGESLLIPLDKAREHFMGQTAIFIDARPRDSFDEGHIEGALSLPLHDLHDRYMDVVARIPPDRLIITYCDGESCLLSEELARFLIEDGFKNVKVLADGWTVWRDRQLPIGEETASP